MAHWGQSGLQLCVHYGFSMSLNTQDSPRAKLAVDPFNESWSILAWLKNEKKHFKYTGMVE